MASLILAVALLAGPVQQLRPSPPPPLVAIAPALTANALREELRASSQRRQDELAAIARERASLEKLAGEIAAARAALEAESTAREKAKEQQQRQVASARQPPPEPPGGKPPPAAGSAEALAKTLKGMKADQASALVGRLARPLAVEVLRRMRPNDVAAMLEKMKPDAAAELFSLMASPSPVAGAR